MSAKEVIVVTGSSGRIGKRLIERLGNQYQCIGLDFIGTTSFVPSMEFVYVDLASDESVRQAFRRIEYAYGKKIASVVHLAAFYSFEGTNLENYDRITVQGTARLLRELKRFEVEQFIFTSTMLVHQPTRRGVKITEDFPVNAKWHYPESKVKTEKLILEQHGNIPVVMIRIAGCYDDECNSIPLAQHIQRIYEKQLASVVFPGNVENGVCYIHFDDVNDQLALLIEKRKKLPPELILLNAEEESLTYRELQTLFSMGLHGKKWPMIHVPKTLAKVGAWAQGLSPIGPPPFIKPWMVDLADDNYEVSMEKSRQVLGWAPKKTLSRSIPKILENFKADPVSWYKRHKIPISRYVLRDAEKKAKSHD